MNSASPFLDASASLHTTALRKAPAFALTALALLLQASAYAQTPPDAGQIQRQLEQSLPSVPTQPPTSLTDTKPAASAQQSTVILRQITIEGAQRIPAEELARQFDPYLNRAIPFGEIEAVAQSLVNLYRQSGWFARIALPQQDLTDGVLRVQITEAHFGVLRVVPSTTRANTDFVSKIVGATLQPGQPYSMDDLERGLLLANDLPGIQADGVLQAGDSAGSSDLALTVSDQPWVSGVAFLGNQGSRSTGQAQATVQLALNNMSGYGDQIRFTGARAEHLEYGQLNYNLPLGTDGLRADLAYNQLHYRLGKEFSALDAKGRNETVQASLSYPLQRNSARNLWLGLALAHGDSRDEVLGAVQRERKIDTTVLSLYGDQRNETSRSMHSWRFDLTHGDAKLQRDDDRNADAASARVGGTFSKLNGSVNRDQWLDTAWYLRARVNAQWSTTNLESSQQFSLGGAYAVRGYPVNEGSGDSGALVQIEVHRLLGDLGLGGIDAYAFIDGGVIRQRHTLWSGWSTADSQRNTYALYASGLGVRWIHASGVQIDGVLAAPIGHNPIATNGLNQDGSSHGTRLWLSASFSF